MYVCMYTYIMLTHVNPRLRHQWLLNGCRWSSWLISSQQQPLQFTSRWDMLGRTDQVPLIERASEIVLACHADVSRDPWFLVLGPTIFQLVGSCRSPRGKGKPTNKCIQMWQTNGFFRTWFFNGGTSISVTIKRKVKKCWAQCVQSESGIFDPSTQSPQKLVEVPKLLVRVNYRCMVIYYLIFSGAWRLWRVYRLWLYYSSPRGFIVSLTPRKYQLKLLKCSNQHFKAATKPVPIRYRTPGMICRACLGSWWGTRMVPPTSNPFGVDPVTLGSAWKYSQVMIQQSSGPQDSGDHGIHGPRELCYFSYYLDQWYTKVSIDQDNGSTLMVYQGILVYWSSRYLRYTKVFYEQPQSGRSNNNNTNFFARLESLHSVQPRPSNFSQSMVNVLKWWCKNHPFLWIQTDGPRDVHWCTLSIHIPQDADETVQKRALHLGEPRPSQHLTFPTRSLSACPTCKAFTWWTVGLEDITTKWGAP